MIRWFVRNGLKLLLGLRYRVEIRGIEEVARSGRERILFLPNHPALIDPFIVGVYLHRAFSPRFLADKDQIDRFLVRRLARLAGARPVPDLVRHGSAVRDEVQASVRECIEGLKQGENLVLYPSGHVYRSRLEDLRGNSAVESILRDAPDIRVVLVRTRGLWGSSFSHAAGRVPVVGPILGKALGWLALNGLLFSPRRPVTIELHEPADFPRHAERDELNRYLEYYYNQDAPANVYIPHTIWQRPGAVELPDPPMPRISGTAADVPETTRLIVTDYLRQTTGIETFGDGDRLAQDLGLDSLARAELIVWLTKEFGFAQTDVDSLQTVGEVMLAACGESVVKGSAELKKVPAKWFRDHGHDRVTVPEGQTIAEVFLRQASRRPERIVIADQLRGARSYRDLITAIYALKPLIESLPGEHVGIMLPASVAANVVYLATVFAGKVPVLVNWTVGARNMLHCLDLVGVRHVLTAGPLLARIESQGTDLTALKDRFVLLEKLAQQLSAGAKLRSWLASRISWSSLRKVKIPAVAAVLFTSGSEAMPKAVPLTHANVLANLRDTLRIITVRHDDRLMSILPPFHSFGLTADMLLPLVSGLRAVYHANPTEAWVLASLIEAYGATIIVGTPTFLSGIVRTAASSQLASLRLAVTGAEKCPERTYKALSERCPEAVILEGYGVTECSPVVAVNDEKQPEPSTIGKVLPSVEYAIVDEAISRRVDRGGTGMLLVRGPSVFDGYLGSEVESPFVEFDGRQWYRTGDLVSEDADGVLTFRGRLKRFVKIAGEMISLPAIEAVLEQQYATDTDEGPVLAVEAAAEAGRPELVLFTTLDLDRQTVNGQLRQAGLSPLHNISRVIRLEHMPVLGTGKTDYRALKQKLAEKPA
jgi:acyl-CoA synthetase (AMP-forming)/AMP-acid ligase II/1-acyl-sn-glycerol-3-phosphate acyltransferase/acyl carrier protein